MACAVGHDGAMQARLVQLRTIEHGAIEVRSAEIGAAQVRSLQVGLEQGALAGAAAPFSRVNEICPFRGETKERRRPVSTERRRSCIPALILAAAEPAGKRTPSTPETNLHGSARAAHEMQLDKDYFLSRV